MKAIAVFFATACMAHAGPADELIKRGDAYDQKQQTQPALDAFLAAEKLEPDNAALEVRISKQYGDLMNDLPNAAQQKTSINSALEHARKAVQLDGDSSDAHLSVAICLGKSTKFMGSKEKIGTSTAIKTEAEKALKLNPKSDYAYHMLGRWHQELAGIGGTERLIAKVVYGTIPPASYDEALKDFQKAIDLRSDRLIHQVEYGRTLAMMGRKAEARIEIQKGLAMPSRDKDDAETKRRGAETLKDL
jgi:tetratricopeptide (TPR) repeat protein